jgi:hypothetical protein
MRSRYEPRAVQGEKVDMVDHGSNEGARDDATDRLDRQCPLDFWGCLVS